MKSSKYFSLALVTGVMISSLMSGCGGSSGSDEKEKPTVVISLNTEANNVSIFTRNKSTEALTLSAEVNNTNEPTDMILHPNAKYAYVVNSDAPQGEWDENASVSAYTYNEADGSIESLGEPVLLSGASINGAITPDGKYLYVADQGDFEVHTLVVGSDGTLTEAGHSPDEVYEAHSIVMHPNGNYFYVGSEENEIHALEIDHTDGSFSALPASPYEADGANNWMVITSDGTKLYSVDASTNNIHGFNISDTNGSLSVIDGFPFENDEYSGFKSCDISPDGKYLYIAHRFIGDSAPRSSEKRFPPSRGIDEGGILTYSIENNGSLTFIERVESGTHPKSIDISADGEMLYTVNNGDNNMSVFHINDSNGSLTLDTKYEVDEGPKRVFVIN